MAINTIGVDLKIADVPDIYQFSKLVSVKDYPDLGGAPEMLETTTLEDEAQTQIPGVRTNGALEFLSNYDKTAFMNLIDNSFTPSFYMVEFKNGASGRFVFKGQHDTFPIGAGVNAVAEMRTVIAPSTEVQFWADNLIINGIFANSYTGWTNTGTTLDTVVKLFGDRSVKIDVTAETATLSKNLTLVSGKKYRVGFWIRKTSGTGLSCLFNGTNIMNTSEFNTLPTDEWTYFYKENIVGSGSKSLTIGAITSATAVANIDGISVIDYL